MFLAWASWLGLSVASASSFYVPDEHSLDAASGLAVSGDVIYVRPGTYDVNITLAAGVSLFTPGVTLRSATADTPVVTVTGRTMLFGTTLDGDGTSPAVLCASGCWLRMSNAAVVNPGGSAAAIDLQGGTAELDSTTLGASSPLTAPLLSVGPSSRAYLREVTLSGASSSSSAAGVHVDASGTLEVEDGRFELLTSSGGYGAAVDSAGRAVFFGATFVDNAAVGAGADVHVRGGTTRLEAVEFLPPTGSGDPDRVWGAGGDVALWDVSFVGESSIVWASSDTLSVVRTSWCDNGGVTALRGATGSSSGTVMLFNSRLFGSGDARLIDFGATDLAVLSMGHNHISGEFGATSSAVRPGASTDVRALANVIEHFSFGFSPAGGVSALDNLFFDTATPFSGSPAQQVNNLVGDPGWTNDRSCPMDSTSYGFGGYELVLDGASASMLDDAPRPRDASSSIGNSDPDGSRADIGPLGGPLSFIRTSFLLDGDNDGTADYRDCAPQDPAVFAYAFEDCSNTTDNDCDAAFDEGTDLYEDLDGDGFGTTLTSPAACSPVVSTAVRAGDCDDGQAQTNPLSFERCNGVDDDCDGDTDPVLHQWFDDVDGDGYGDPATATFTCVSGDTFRGGDCDDGTVGSGAVSWFRDSDQDGYGSSSLYPPEQACPDAPPTIAGVLYVTESADCDDGDPAIFPLATDGDCDGEDQDCDGVTDEDSAWAVAYADEDRDGFGAGATIGLACVAAPGVSATDDDCDNFDPFRNPGRAEVCNELDEDCDVGVDEELPLQTYYLDLDGDTYTSGTVIDCGLPANALASPSAQEDCDDGTASRRPGAAELCDGLDDDCDGVIDEQPTTGGVSFVADADGDGFTDSNTTRLFCSGATPDGWKQNASADPDCDDGSSLIGAPPTWYPDIDDDGFGRGPTTQIQCDEPSGTWSTTFDDCDDNEPLVFPGATEICNEVNDDCDGATDEGVVQSWTQDSDGDSSYGTNTQLACDAPFPAWQWTTTPTGVVDCDDNNAQRYPGNVEACDGADNDCDPNIDEGVQVTVYVDGDSDDYGDTAVTGCPGIDGVVRDGDCNDGLASVHPNAPEICEDGVDQDCTGADASCDSDDSDGDGFCPSDCTDGSRPGDCDDADPAVHPSANEALTGCDGIDNNCDGQVDEYLSADRDEDTFTSLGSCLGSADDCNDFIATIYVGAAESCDGLDQDCDDIIDEGRKIDADGDGFFAPSGCLDLNPHDCDDADPDVYPGAVEVAGNGVDDDCDGLEDENEARTDQDGDGYCESSACDDGALTGDCDDADPAVSPGQPFDVLGDGIDNDCDGAIDEGANVDRDGDGVTLAAGDCNDGNAAVYPGAEEVCDGFDNDCDGYLPQDELDADRDGVRSCEGDCDDFDAAARPGIAENCADAIDNNCNGIINEDADSDLDGYTTCEGDCNDLDASVNPAAPEESCNRVDDNCNGLVDEGLDRDGDGFIACEFEASCTPAITECDCNDLNALVAPDLPEICGDGLDNNCDGGIDNDVDNDGDHYTTCGGDCDDNDPYVSPGMPETCDGEDNDCDRAIDETFDKDEDGVLTCRGDCDDAFADTYPLAEELCDARDNDCNAIIDEPWPDLDGDGTTECTVPADCDETSDQRSEALPEVCDNGMDDDCDALADWQDPDCDAGAFPAYWFCSTSGAPPRGGLPALALLFVALGRRRRVSAPSAPMQ